MMMMVVVVVVAVIVLVVVVVVVVVVMIDLNPPQSVATTDKCKGGEGGRGASEKNEIDIRHNHYP